MLILFDYMIFKIGIYIMGCIKLTMQSHLLKAIQYTKIFGLVLDPIIMGKLHRTMEGLMLIFHLGHT